MDQVAEAMRFRRQHTLGHLSLAAIVGVCGCYSGIDDQEQAGDASADGGSAGGTANDSDGGTAGDDGGDDGGGAPTECEGATAPSIIRMLNRREYKNTLRDLLALDQADVDNLTAAVPADAVVGFDNHAEALVASPVLVEQHMAVAEDAADAVPISVLTSCDGGSEDDCIDGFITDFGTRAFRRPLQAQESSALRSVYDYARADGQSFDDAARLVLEATLQSPQFLYRIETSAGDGVEQISDYEMASRLSYFFWASMPDDELFAAAADGELRTIDQVESQALRLMSDAKAAETVHSFHALWLEMNRLDASTKDEALAPGFESLKPSLEAETLALTDHAFWEADQADALLLSDVVFVNHDLAQLYGIDGTFGSIVQSVPATDTRFGLLTQAAVLAAHSNDNRTSPTRRGRFVRGQLLCTEPPPPPAGVDMLPVPDGSEGGIREQLDRHASDPACSGCHALIDPIGLGLENYDLVGRYRTTDNGEAIDASGELVAVEVEDTTFVGARELSERLAESQEFEECIVEQWFRFAMGRRATTEDECTMERLRTVMAETDGSMQELVIAIATSEAFFYLDRGVQP